MAFHDVLHPQVFSYRTRKEFTTDVDQYKADNGDLFTWSSRRVHFGYGLVYQNRTYAQLAELKRFYLCRGGPLNSFRFNDPLDCNTSASGHGTITGVDQPIVTIDGKRYLAKQYGTFYRVIKLPDTGLQLLVTDGGSAVSGITVNDLTGEITGHTPTGAYRWGGWFDVPVHFTLDPFSPTYNEDDGCDLSVSVLETLEDLE